MCFVNQGRDQTSDQMPFILLKHSPAGVTKTIPLQVLLKHSPAGVATVRCRDGDAGWQHHLWHEIHVRQRNSHWTWTKIHDKRIGKDNRNGNRDCDQGRRKTGFQRMKWMHSDRTWDSGPHLILQLFSNLWLYLLFRSFLLNKIALR